MSGSWLGDIFGGIGTFVKDNSGWLGPLAQAGVSLYGANQQANAARQTAQAQQQGLAQAGQFQQQGTAEAIAAQERIAAQNNALLRDVYNTSRADQAPYREAGYNALGQFAANANVPFGQDPGYQFRVQEGQRALQNSAAARGAFGSGATARALVDYGQQAGSQEYGTYMNRLASLAGMGQTAVGGTQQAGQNYGSGVAGTNAGVGNALSSLLSSQGTALGNLSTAGGMAQAGGIQGASNAWNQGVNNLLSYAYGR